MSQTNVNESENYLALHKCCGMKIRVGHSLFNGSVVTDTFILNNRL